MTDAAFEAKLKSMSDDLELMAHITSHALRDPLRQAVINCEKLEGQVADAASKELVAQTAASIRDVLLHIDLLRQYSHLANFDKPLVPVDCQAVLAAAMAAMQDKITASHARVEAATLPAVMGYEEHLVKLFAHLIDNAIMFNNAPEPVISIGCADKGEMWEFSVADNGVGLPEVYRKLVFALFQSLDPEAGHIGAGLAMCKKIVENHHGEIWFHSDGESGSCFYFTLPKAG